MRTVEWIAKNKGVADGHIRMFNSVVKDGLGVIYSYGPHYPLLFEVNGVWFVNNRGYSVTTAKHINWAHEATGYKAHNIKVAGHTGGVTAQDAEHYLRQEMAGLIYEMSKKKRQDTQVYLNLRDRLASTYKALNALTGQKGETT